MLIYEFMPNKSLDYFIFGMFMVVIFSCLFSLDISLFSDMCYYETKGDRSKKLLLDWRLRCEIIIGVARGILYLHQDSRLRIIHQDLKLGNVLLEGEMNPKILDFGTVKIFQEHYTSRSTKRVFGT